MWIQVIKIFIPEFRELEFKHIQEPTTTGM
jgi:hypothetical protein